MAEAEPSLSPLILGLEVLDDMIPIIIIIISKSYPNHGASLFEKAMARFALRELEVLVLEPKMCLNVRSEKALCKRCLEVCPSDAITFNDEWGLEIDVLSCQRCLLCTAACPNGAILPRFESDPYVKARISVGQMVREGVVKPLTFICAKKVKARTNGNAIAVPCIGCISDDTLLLCRTVTGKMPVWKGCRKGCALSKGQALWKGAVRRAGSLVRLHIIRVPDIDVEIPDIMTRRNFLRESGKTLISLALDDVSEYLESLGEGPGKDRDPAPGSAWVKAEPRRLRRINSMLAGPRTKRKGSRDIGPSIDGRSCTACGACAAICPTGAMHIISGDGVVMFLFDHERCTECGGCKAICPEGALAYKGGNPFEPRKLLQLDVKGCASCGLVVVLTHEERAALRRRGGKVICRSCRRNRS